MADAFTGSNYYKHSFTEYEVEACKRDTAKRAQGCDECSQTEYEVEAYNWDVADAHIFTAAPGAPAAKIEPRAVLDAEMAALAAEIDAAISASKPKTKRSAELDAAKHAQGCNECSPAAKIEPRAVLDAEIPALEAEIAAATEAKAKRSAELDAEITALMVEIATAKTKRNHKLAAMDAEIAALEAELAASKTKPNAVET
jgi:hypothetical protein